MNRKDDHISGALNQTFKHNDFDEIRFIHDPLAASSVEHVNVKKTFANQTFSLPIYINAMTGGSVHAYEINKRLAMLAKHFNLPLALGSVKAGLRDRKWEESFKIVREIHPDGFIMANIGGENTLEIARRAIELIDASLLQIHLNPVQELIMPEGDRDFSLVKANIQKIASSLDVPIVVKEVGFGMSRDTLQRLKTLGVTNVDISGRGGTNFASIENARRRVSMDYLSDWGQSTVESLLEATQVSGLTIIASGGVRNPLDAVKALRLGASMVGMSGYFLKLVKNNTHEEAVRIFDYFIRDFKKIMTLIGADTIDEIADKPIVLSQKLIHYMNERQIKGVR
ncbi:MAG: type 2 isopentenyl-diphosphate Delta-isomerase [Bacillota bacterium]